MASPTLSQRKMPKWLSTDWPNRSNAENSTFSLSTKLQVRAAEFFLFKLLQLFVDKMESHWLSTELKAVSCCLTKTKLRCLIRFESSFKLSYNTNLNIKHLIKGITRIPYIVGCRGVVQLGVSWVSPTKVEAHKSFLFTEISLALKKRTLGWFLLSYFILISSCLLFSD